VEEIRNRMPDSTPRAILETHILENTEGRMRTAVRIGEGKEKQANYPDQSLKIDPSTDI
jgi:hypothetical protein